MYSQRGVLNLGLTWNPDISFLMQGAGGHLDKTLGLARNVEFRIEDIVLLVQLHVLENPPYNILLGRPFDVLTESVVSNYANGDQSITITDPRSGQKLVVPTYARGTNPAPSATPSSGTGQGFQASMN